MAGSLQGSANLPFGFLSIVHCLLDQGLVPLHGRGGQDKGRVCGGICGLVYVDGCNKTITLIEKLNNCNDKIGAGGKKPVEANDRLSFFNRMTENSFELSGG